MNPRPEFLMLTDTTGLECLIEVSQIMAAVVIIETRPDKVGYTHVFLKGDGNIKSTAVVKETPAEIAELLRTHSILVIR